MSHIDDLITRLCPDGVEFKPLGEVARIKNGRDHKGLGDGVIPVYGSGGIMRYVDAAATEGPSVLIPRKGSLGNIFYVEGQFWVVDTIFRTEVDQTKIVPKFFYHVLLMMKLDEMNQAGGVPSQTQSSLIRLRIPVPPLEIQREIVRILDTFSKLEAELEAELEARRAQYAFYRDQLLSFPERGVARVPMVEIAELFNLKNGYTPSRSNPNFWSEGSIPWFRMEDIRLNGGVLSSSIQHISASAVKGGHLFPKDSLIVATSATIGWHALVTVDHLSNQRFTSLSLKSEYIDQLDMKFAYYYAFKLDSWCLENVTTSSFASVDMGRFRRFRFALPPLEEQRRIVAILDKFDALVNDLSVGLPAELAVRRKQYEYYRDRLLTFKEKTS